MKRHKNQPPVKRICAFCAANFLYPACLVRYYGNKGGQFCSRVCGNASRVGELTVDRVLENCIPEPNSGCWLWTGALHHEFGYGKLGYGRRKYEASHRASYIVFNGEIPPGLFVRHTCDNPHCVNPEHLSLGTAAQNAADMVARNRSLKGSRNYSAKLNESDVANIKRRLAAGEYQYVIAHDYGVYQSCIGKIATGESWRHVPTYAEPVLEAA